MCSFYSFAEHPILVYDAGGAPRGASQLSRAPRGDKSKLISVRLTSHSMRLGASSSSSSLLVHFRLQGIQEGTFVAPLITAIAIQLSLWTTALCGRGAIGGAWARMHTRATVHRYAHEHIRSRSNRATLALAPACRTPTTRCSLCYKVTNMYLAQQTKTCAHTTMSKAAASDVQAVGGGRRVPPGGVLT